MRVKSPWLYLVYWGAGTGFLISIYLLAVLFSTFRLSIAPFYYWAALIIPFVAALVGASIGAIINSFFAEFASEEPMPSWVMRFAIPISLLIGLAIGVTGYAIFWWIWVIMIGGDEAVSGDIAVLVPSLFAGGMTMLAVYSYLRLALPKSRKRKAKYE